MRGVTAPGGRRVSSVGTSFDADSCDDTMTRSLPRFLGLLGLATILGCGSSSLAPPSPCDTELCDVTGRVTWMSFEGGFFAIRGDDNVLYDTHDLPAGFREDGLRVSATLRRRLDLGCIHMAGTIADVQTIRRL